MKNLFCFSFLAFVASGILSGCGEKSSTNRENAITLGDVQFLAVAGSAIRNASGITGDATLQSMKPYSFAGGIRYTYTFTLEDGGSIALLANGNNDLSKAVAFTVVRTGAVITSASAVSPTGTEHSWIEFLNGENLDATKSITLVFDVHNESDGTGLIVGVPGKEGEHENEQEVESLSGRNWGFRLKGATLSAVKIEPAAHQH